MIQDHTIDQALIELARTMKALKALRAARKASDAAPLMSEVPFPSVQHAAALRAALDCRYKLADLRQGR